jgi:hypothetical protein
MSTDFPTAPLAPGHIGAGGGAVEKSPSALHTKNLTLPLESTSKLLPFLTLASLAISVSYDYGYVTGLGLSFISLPTTMSDHVRSFLVWFPWGIAVTIVLGLPRLPHTPPTPASILSSDSSASKLSRYYDASMHRWLAPLLFILLLTLIALQGVYALDHPALTAAFLVLLWSLVYSEVIHYTRLRYNVGVLTSALLYGPIALILFYSFGQLDTYQLRNASAVSSDASLVLKGTVGSPQKVRVLRSFDKVLLLLLPTGEVQVLSSSEVLTITYDKQPKRNPDRP